MRPSVENAESSSPLQSYLELLRLPNVFTAAADVAAGFFFVQAAWAFDSSKWPPALLTIAVWAVVLLIAASAALYLSGMVLNDVFDLKTDRNEQPWRPLPSGRISLAAARALGWSLLALGVVLAAAVSGMLQYFPPAHTPDFGLAWRPVLVAAGLAALIVLYNAWLKRTLLGPVAMGGCRALNVLLGMSVLREPWQIEHGLVAAGVGVYIAGVTWFARDDARRSQRWQLIAATAVMVTGVAIVGILPWFSHRIDRLLTLALAQDLWKWYAAMVLIAGMVVTRTAPAIVEPSPGPVRAAVGRSIVALVILDAAACLAGAGPTYAILVAALIVPTVFVRRWVKAG